MPNPPPLLDDMLLFTELVAAGSLTAGSARLGMRKSTASRRLSALEERLGTRLMERSARQLRLTEEGRAYHARCRELVEQAEALNRATREARGTPHGTLKIATESLLADALAPLVTELLLRHPELRAELVMADAPHDAGGDGCDVFLRTGPLADSSLHVQRLGTLRVGYFASPGYLARRGTPQAPPDLTQHEQVQISSAGADEVWFFSGPRRGRTVRVEGRLRVSTIAAGRTAARAGLGVVRLPWWEVATDVASGLLRPVLEPWTPEGAPVFAVYAGGKAAPARVRAFLRLLDERRASLPWARAEGDNAER